jgi:hydroxymethylpyrimidine/phosphomethylpyrimidine kinase
MPSRPHLPDPETAPTPPIALTVAGFDPSSGAGITADLKVFAAFHLFGVAAITALTVQSTQGVLRTEPVEPEILAETLDCLAEDIEISGVKIGMLGTRASVMTVARFLGEAGIARENIVLDPVLRSSSGRALLDSDGIESLRGELLPVVGWITPNIDELAVLTGRPSESIQQAANLLGGNYPGLNIVVTGGHLDRPDDFLRTVSGEEFWFPGKRIETTATHGTGCAFSSALLARLLAGDAAPEAVAGAKKYVRSAMQAAYPIGKGRGPLHHLYGL